MDNHDTKIRGTLFSTVYNFFLGKITDDMYVAFGQEDTYRDLEQMLLVSVLSFSFPKQDIRKYDLHYDDSDNLSRGKFEYELTIEEIDILSSYMILEWIKRQIAHCRYTELHYSGSDAKVLNVKTQLAALKILTDTFKRDLNSKLYFYYGRTENAPSEINLSGKNVKL